MPPTSPSDALVQLIRGTGSDELIELAGALERGEITLRSSSVGLAAVKGVTNDTATRAYPTFRFLATSDLNEKAVAVAIRTAVGIRTDERLDRPQVEITWTGPDAEGPLVKPTPAAVEQLIKDCRETGEILLVGYSLTAPEGSFMRRIIDLLVEASNRRAKIQVVLHKDDEAKNKAQLLDHWSIFARKPLIYTWQPTSALPYTKLHAKCLVVDRLQMLVTSANFTLHGLESNIELGLLVRNQPLASAVHERFDYLINAQVLRPWEEQI